MKHTPGPWLVWESPYGGARIHAGHEVTIADVMSRGGAEKQAFEANSKLIAAAPELLDALIELVEIVEAVRDGEGVIDTFTTQPAMAALRKAGAATRNVAPEQFPPLADTGEGRGKSKPPGGKSCEAPGKSAHSVQWSGTFRGTNEDPRETGWCEVCGREVYDGDGHGNSPNVAGASLFVAEKSPLPECSICRGRHGREVEHACE